MKKKLYGLLDELCKKEMKKCWEGDEWSKKDLHELSYDLSIEEIDELLNKLLERISWSVYYQNIKCVIAKNQDDLLKSKSNQIVIHLWINTISSKILLLGNILFQEVSKNTLYCILITI